MTHQMTRMGRCFCGDLSVTIAGDPLLVSSCACTRCQRRTGSFFGVTVYVRPDQIVARTGTSDTFQAPGATTTFHRCARCGTSLWWVPDDEDDIVGMAGGCFAGQDLPAPQRMVHTATRHPFVCTPPGLPEHEDGPPE
ncbi:MAG: aldehyde-activating protein [Phenylobacterium sp.]|nr:aldehyde-activating protein [Phenylobacterium sp.]